MDYNDIRQLMREFSDSSIGKLSLELDNVKLSLEKQLAVEPVTVSQPQIIQTVKAASQLSVEVVAEDEMQAKSNETAVCSPVVGTYYATPSPDAPPFVTVGQTVKKGQTLCIIEAMKMMNEIPAPVSGRVTRVLAKPESAVEYDQPLMFIEKDC